MHWNDKRLSRELNDPLEGSEEQRLVGKMYVSVTTYHLNSILLSLYYKMIRDFKGLCVNHSLPSFCPHPEQEG